ncbi:carbohydrate kinase family protein [Nocardia takedensis]|uniref:carbohydrate kinase family protein n=1 Tax=Nocardia takedensis TaxID=259390 RepID=UPI001FE0696A|nr:PfkB family carbohydrate kinase [Nocardia takedensis]
MAATMGADGVLLAAGDTLTHVPGFATEVVDTTGCGDAFSAGFLVGVTTGREVRQAAVLGGATAALVAGGLGTDHGEFDLAAADAFAAATPALTMSHALPHISLPVRVGCAPGASDRFGGRDRRNPAVYRACRQLPSGMVARRRGSDTCRPFPDSATASTGHLTSFMVTC